MIKHLIESSGPCDLLLMSALGAAVLVTLVCALFSFVDYVFLGNTFDDDNNDVK